MKKKHIYLMILALMLVVSAGSTGIHLVLGKAEYKASDLELWEGQADYNLLVGIEYDAQRYILSVQDLGGFDINALGSYTVSYALNPIPVEPSVELRDSIGTASGSEDRSDSQPGPSVDNGAEDAAPGILGLLPKAAAKNAPPQASNVLAASGSSVAFEMPVDAEGSAAPILFSRQVVVKEAVTYEDQRLDLGMADLLVGFIKHVEGYSVSVVDDGGFDPGVINEYQVTYALHSPSGTELRQFQRYIQVTQVGVEFYAPQLAAEGDWATRNWVEDVDFDRTRYTITLLTQPNLEATRSQRLLYRLDEIIPTEIEVDLTADTKTDFTQINAVEDPDANLVAIFGREVILLHAGSEAEKLITFTAPDLVITVEQLENMNYIDLLQGVTAVDENGEAVQVQVFDRSQLDQAGLPPTGPEVSPPIPLETPISFEDLVEPEKIVEVEALVEEEAPVSPVTEVSPEVSPGIEEPIEPETLPMPDVLTPPEASNAPKEPVETEGSIGNEAKLELEIPTPLEASKDSEVSEVSTEREDSVLPEDIASAKEPNTSKSPVVVQRPGESPIVFENPENPTIPEDNSENAIAMETVEDHFASGTILQEVVPE